jgi:hypothetical protein
MVCYENGKGDVMRLSEFIKRLQELEEQGHGELPVYAVHGASGVISPMSLPSLETGDPEYMNEEIEYIDVYIGN